MSYPSDLSDAEWAILAPQLQPEKQGRGRPRIHPLRPQVNALLYVLTTGCQWRALPDSFPHWTRCYDQFHRWRESGKFQAVLINLPDAPDDGSESAVLADSGFNRDAVHGMVGAGGRTLHIGAMSGRPPQPPLLSGPNRGFRLTPIRWVVERTNAWMSSCRRLNREHERTTASHECFVWLAALRLLLRRVTRSD